MSTPRLTAVVLATAAVTVAGCLRYTSPIISPVPPTEAERNFQAVWEAGRWVLGRYYFELDRQDRRAGIMTTHPMVGRHFFEFWRPDASTPSDVLEGSIQTVVRSVTVAIRPDYEGAQTYTPAVEVRLWRSDRPTPEVSSTSEAYGLVGAGGDDPSGDEWFQPGGSAVTTEGLVPIGRDEKLEARLAEDIRSKAVEILSGAPKSRLIEAFERAFGR